jgi:hypothetical protein
MVHEFRIVGGSILGKGLCLRRQTGKRNQNNKKAQTPEMKVTGSVFLKRTRHNQLPS